MTLEQVVREVQNRFDINAILAKRLVTLADKNNPHDYIIQFLAEKPKPFVKWVGGKRQLLAQFRKLNLYPPEKFNPSKNRYFEPFLGGGAVFFDLIPVHATLSDLNGELITTYKVVRDNVEQLITALKKHKTDKEYFLKVRAKDVSKMTDVEIASRFIFLNRTAFNGLYRVNKSGQFNVPFGKYKNPLICDEQNLRKASASLRHVEIKHQDYKSVLKNAKKGDFIYFDPPYHPVSKTAAFTAYTAQGFGEKEQTELRDVFLELHKRGCFVMLSNSDVPFINKIYSQIKLLGVRITKINATRLINVNVTGRGKIKEVLITNY